MEINSGKTKGKLIIRGYCPHGDIEIWRSKFLNINRIHGDKVERNTYLLCDSCKDLFFQSYNPSEAEIRGARKSLKNIPHKESHIKIFYPLVYLSILRHSSMDKKFYEKLFLFQQNLKNRICKNCGETIKRFSKKSHLDFCSQKCSIENLKKKGHYSKIRKNYHIKNIILDNRSKYPLLKFDIEAGGIIKDYCCHGDLKISYKEFNKLYPILGKKLNDSAYLCNECLSERSIPSERNELADIELYSGESNQAKTEVHIKKYYPYVWKYIWTLPGSDWIENRYLFDNYIENPPSCSTSDCNNPSTFNKSQLRYNLSCNDHLYEKIQTYGLDFDIMFEAKMKEQSTLRYHRNFLSI